jgi:hypothetical protein
VTLSPLLAVALKLQQPHNCVGEEGDLKRQRVEDSVIRILGLAPAQSGVCFQKYRAAKRIQQSSAEFTP